MQATLSTRRILAVSAIALTGFFGVTVSDVTAATSIFLDDGNNTSLPVSIPGPDPRFGSVNVRVDGYGSFGANPFGINPQLAVYQDIGSAGSVTFASGVAIGFAGNPTRQFLSSGSIGGAAANPAGAVNVTGSGAGYLGNSLSGASAFSLGGLSFTVNQTLAPFAKNPPFSGVGVVGSELRQTYTIQNTTGSTISFDLFRYIDPDIVVNSGTGLNSGGGRIVTPINNNVQHEFLFATETAVGGPHTQSVFEAITAEGGVIPTSGRYSIVQVTGSDAPLGQNIVNGLALNNAIAGDGNFDGWVDAGPGYDIAMALRNSFTLAPGQSIDYVTSTYFGSGSPDELRLALVPETSTVVSCAVLVGLAGLTFLRRKQAVVQA